MSLGGRVLLLGGAWPVTPGGPTGPAFNTRIYQLDTAALRWQRLGSTVRGLARPCTF